MSTPEEAKNTFKTSAWNKTAPANGSHDLPAGSPEPGITRRDHIDILVEALTKVSQTRNWRRHTSRQHARERHTSQRLQRLHETLQTHQTRTARHPRTARRDPRTDFQSRRRTLGRLRLHPNACRNLHSLSNPNDHSEHPTQTAGLHDTGRQEHFSLNLDVLTPELLAERIEETLDNREMIRSSLLEARAERIEALDVYANRIAKILQLPPAS